jgi:RNA polymerase sigma factor (sigma-70 family)
MNFSTSTLPEKPTDQQLLEGLWSNDYQALKMIYGRYLPQVLTFVKKHGGSDSEGEDVFQDVLIVLFKKKEAEFALTSGLGTYLIGVSRFVWLRKQRKNKREVRVTSAHTEGLSDTKELETTLLGLDKRKLFREKMTLLGQSCQRVLRMFFAKIPLGEIAQKMGYTPNYIKKKNRTCKLKLTKLIQEDYRYRDLS